MPQASANSPAIKAYWQPGCTSCLRMKEFLTKHGVPFVSVNVLEDNLTKSIRVREPFVIGSRLIAATMRGRAAHVRLIARELTAEEVRDSILAVSGKLIGRPQYTSC